MLDWLKGTWTAILVAIAAGLSAMAVVKARQHKKNADKWKAIADDQQQIEVTRGVENAKQAMTQAKAHEAKAREAKEVARQRLDRAAVKDEDMATVLSGWRSSRIRQP